MTTVLLWSKTACAQKATYRIPFGCYKKVITQYFSSSGTLNDSRLFLCGWSLLLSRPTERCTKRLRSDTQSTGLFDDRLVYRQCRAVDLDDVLREDDRLAGVSEKATKDGGARTFSRSILASAAIRVSRMRLTIHFSPSSGERLSRAERSLGEKISALSSFMHEMWGKEQHTRCRFAGGCDSTPR